ncbi:hypothetical protein G3O08_18030 [Cryomorpha ignava]|uniref:Uncharacterized protein n=1 Tax=Cryomorpha ignava TaxID=101383 RepID=A0A7K3WUP5_9FLAO|nr:hypothetical protein [Cryomorpha ignava]NEN25399.1 hypothetical protein [Cryomorpha ignava]
MKKLLILSWIMLQALPILLAQSPSDSSKVELEGLSRSEIRQIFLSMEETSESYNLAFSSRKANRQSIRSFVTNQYPNNTEKSDRNPTLSTETGLDGFSFSKIDVFIHIC